MLKSAFVVLTGLFWLSTVHAVQVSDLDWMVGSWGTSMAVTYNNLDYVATLEIKKISNHEITGELIISDGTQTTAQQKFIITNGPNQTLAFDLKYDGNVGVPGYWDGPVNPAGNLVSLRPPPLQQGHTLRRPNLLGLPPTGHESLTCDAITDSGSLIDGNGNYTIRRYETVFRTTKDIHQPMTYPTAFIINVLPPQGGASLRLLMLSLLWNESGRLFNIYNFQPVQP